MGQREDLVRQRLAEEKRRRQEKADMQARTKAAKLVLLNKEYDELIAAFDEEGQRIAEELKNSDWSKAKLRTFSYVKKHWWTRKRSEEFAVLCVASNLRGWSIWMRSDDWLFIGDRREDLRRPAANFPRDANQQYIMEDHVDKMRAVLDALKELQVADVA